MPETTPPYDAANNPPENLISNFKNRVAYIGTSPIKNANQDFASF